jgi:GST-like protein
MFESGAILVYLADKKGQFIGTNAAERAEVMTWLMWQMGGLGPMFGQMGFFHKFAGSEIEDPRPKQRYLDESKRLLTVLDGHLEGRDWVAGDYSIADMAIAPWLRALDFYGTKELLGFDGFKNVSAYLDRFLAREAVQRGLIVPPREPA